MKTEKLNLKSIKNVLSRAEMKKIMAGSGGGGTGGTDSCPVNTPVYSCYDASTGNVWTVEWCCGPGPNYVGPVTCSFIGKTPAASGQETC